MTTGLEEEVLLLDPAGGELAPRAAEVLGRLARPELFKLELPAAQLEILTPAMANAADAAAVLAHGRRELRDLGADVVRPIGCGAPPTGGPTGELNSGERYAAILADYRAVARHQLVCALQVHVGVRGADRALAVYNGLRSFLPAIAALAANAPYRAGSDTGMASIRPAICTMLPRQGVPPAIADWESFAADLRWGAAAGAVPEPRRWWWELRPHVGFGTLEVRVADTQICPQDSAAVAAFVHCLVGWLADRHDAGETLPVHSSWRIAENRWSACRDGVQGTVADLTTGAPLPTRAWLEDLLEALAPVAVRLSCAPALDHAASLCAVNGAMRQRAFAGEHGPRALLGWLADCFVETP